MFLLAWVLIVVVLLQSGKGGGLASAFGGAGGTDAVFGGRGAATFLSKSTTVLGTLFFVTSLSLAISSTSGLSRPAVPRENIGIREPLPFNPEEQLLIEEAEPPASEEVEEAEEDNQ